MMNYFKQIFYEMKHQKMMTWVSISGTALSIFLVMIFFITDNLHSVDMGPEKERGNILVGEGFHIEEGENVSSGMGLQVDMAEKFYLDLPDIDIISFIEYDSSPEILGVKNGESTLSHVRKVDADYWKMFHFNYLQGKPFDEEMVKSGEKYAVISRSTARKLFGEENVVDRIVELKTIPYRVVGVVDDGHPLSSFTYADIFTPFDKEAVREEENRNGDKFGSAVVLMKMKDGGDVDAIKRIVKSRFERMNGEYAKEGRKLVYHDQPYTNDEFALDIYSNHGPDKSDHDRKQWGIYLVVLLLPAINLSSMTRSRLRHRISEIGVRRAFGAKKYEIVGQLIGENFIITCIGGLLGLLGCFIFLYLASHLFFSFAGKWETSLDIINATPDLSMLFRWQNFLLTFIACFVLNVISSTVPAWKAAAKNPAEAISKSR